MSVTHTWGIFFFCFSFHLLSLFPGSLARLLLLFRQYYEWKSQKKILVHKMLWWPFHYIIILTLDNSKGIPYWHWHRGLLYKEMDCFFGSNGLQIISAPKRQQSEFYFNSFYFWISLQLGGGDCPSSKVNCYLWDLIMFGPSGSFWARHS